MDEFLPGQLVAGRYRIESLIGEGGLSRVYRATQLSTGKAVAIKRLHLASGLVNEIGARFAREAMSQSRSSNDAVVAIIEVVMDDGQPALVMELMEGRTLDQVLEQRTLTSEEVIALGLRITSGLQAVHQAGFVHGDVKPSNIFVPHEDMAQAKIGDLGLAEFTSRAGQTETGTVLGTPLYMSPEAARGQRRSAASDIWSLGVVLFESAYGRVPFDGDGVAGVLMQVLTHDPVFPPDPRGLDVVLRRALAKGPAERFQSMSDLADALSDCQNPSNRRKAQAALPLAGAAPMALPSAQASAAISLEASHRIERRSTATIVLLTSGLTSLLAFAVWLAIRAATGPQFAAPFGLAARGVFALAAGIGSAALARAVIGTFERRRPATNPTVMAGTHRVRRDARMREVLSQSIAVAVDSLLIHSSGDPTIDLRRASLAFAIEDFSEAKTRGDKRAALDRAIDIADRLQSQIMSHAQPWYVRRKDGIAVVTALLVAAATLISKILELTK
jgi:eukaryotic-like serine/threonine-protein kinase